MAAGPDSAAELPCWPKLLLNQDIEASLASYFIYEASTTFDFTSPCTAFYIDHD